MSARVRAGLAASGITALFACSPYPDGGAPGSDGHQSAGAAYLSGEEEGGGEAPAAPDHCHDESGPATAHFMVQRAIRKRARDPGSTKFPLTGNATELLGENPCRWRISATGRSKNAFGGYSIVSYTAVATLDGGAVSVDEIKVKER